jgi:hypothetical protein
MGWGVTYLLPWALNDTRKSPFQGKEQKKGAMGRSVPKRWAQVDFSACPTCSDIVVEVTEDEDLLAEVQDIERAYAEKGRGSCEDEDHACASNEGNNLGATCADAQVKTCQACQDGCHLCEAGADSTKMVHGRARAPSRQTLRVAANEVRSRVAPPKGADLFLLSQTGISKRDVITYS